MPKTTNICQYRGVVDLGDGPLTVRCTEVGEHENHKVDVNLGKGPRDVAQRNVFEGVDDD